MSKIKEQDILKLLRGEASAKKLKALEEWSSKSTSNAMALEHYQRIYDESDHLSSYKSVDVNSEWEKFTTKIKPTVSELELLNYFDGVATPKQKSNIEDWKKDSPANEKEFNLFDTVLSESSKLTSYKTVDINDEWQSFSKAIKGQVSPPNLTVVGSPPLLSEDIKVTSTPQSTTKTYVPPVVPMPSASSTTSIKSKEVALDTTPKMTSITSTNNNIENKLGEDRSKRIFMWRALAVAASLLLLSVFGINMWNNSNSSSPLGSEDQYLTVSTQDSPEIFNISDGSIIALGEQTTLTYFKDVTQIDERSVTIDGNGEFDVASNPSKPFTVKAKRSGIGIRVIGTRFRLEDSDEFIEVIENIEGSVRAYSIADTTTFVVMTAGDKYGFDGTNFINLNDRVEEYNGQEYDALYILDYLMKESDWRVTSSPTSSFDSKAMINIDLSKSYEEILEDLRQRSDFDYIHRDCDGCYQITQYPSK